ncbi:hypothetical protein QJQ45_023525 [Haematococcus lacustris]|nr:hypothetical protein QJQ45_023525 [Haematococcus lacustris]
MEAQQQAQKQGAVPYYNTDAGNKMMLATCVQSSPLRYSIMHSTAPRLQDSDGRGLGPFGVYKTDTAHRKTIESTSRDSRVFYAASFNSATPRISRPWSSPVVDAFYDVERLKDAHPSTLSRALAWTPRKYSVMTAKFKRFHDPPAGQGSDVMYDLDRGTKATLHTAMLQSPIAYRNVGAQPVGPSVMKPGSAAGRSREERWAHMGPGTYDTRLPHEVQTSTCLDTRYTSHTASQVARVTVMCFRLASREVPAELAAARCWRPLSSMASRSPRFARAPGASSRSALGSTWSPDKDAAAWAQRSPTISKTQYLRPQYLPTFFKQKAEAAPGK